MVLMGDVRLIELKLKPIKSLAQNGVIKGE